MAEREIKFADKSHARFFAAFFELGENLEQVVLRALLPNDFRHPGVSKADRVTLPNAHRLWDRRRDHLAGVAITLPRLDPCLARVRLD
jgi:hypothetical protein